MRKALPEIPRRDASQARETAAHGLLRAEAATGGDALDGSARLAELTLRGLDAQTFDSLGRSQAGRLSVAPQERAFAHAGSPRQARD